MWHLGAEQPHLQETTSAAEVACFRSAVLEHWRAEGGSFREPKPFCTVRCTLMSRSSLAASLCCSCELCYAEPVCQVQMCCFNVSARVSRLLASSRSLGSSLWLSSLRHMKFKTSGGTQSLDGGSHAGALRLCRVPRRGRSTTALSQRVNAAVSMCESIDPADNDHIASNCRTHADAPVAGFQHRSPSSPSHPSEAFRTSQVPAWWAACGTSRTPIATCPCGPPSTSLSWSRSGIQRHMGSICSSSSACLLGHLPLFWRSVGLHLG